MKVHPKYDEVLSLRKLQYKDKKGLNSFPINMDLIQTLASMA